MTELKSNPQKESLTIFAQYLPKNLAIAIFENLKINQKTKAGQLNKAARNSLSQNATGLILNAIDITKGEEIVTAGGIDLKEIDAKTMQSKLVENLFFCGEVIDIDGLTGGFNLQNCWSTGFIVGNTLKEK